MKKRVLHIALSCLLLANLLFTQVGANFLHTHEAESKELHQSKEHNTTTIDVTTEKCVICAMHLFHDLFYEGISSFHFLHRSELRFLDVVFANLKAVTIFSKGRAPPFL